MEYSLGLTTDNVIGSIYMLGEQIDFLKRNFPFVLENENFKKKLDLLIQTRTQKNNSFSNYITYIIENNKLISFSYVETYKK